MKKKNFITIGTFDGVHIGHQFLFGRLEALAAQYRQNPLVLYFPFPPKTLLSSTPEMTVLTTPEEKKKLFKKAGTPARLLDFATCKDLTSQAFFDTLCTQYSLGGLLVGPDFAFGKDRQGDVNFLRARCQQAGIPFHMVDFSKTGTEKISSSLVRKILAGGDIPTANALLGRPYELTGRVIKGHQLGRKLGFPTANLDTGIYKILPLGVFAVKVRVGRRLYDGFCNIGFRPTVNTLSTKLPLTEVNIFDFKQSIYGRNITIWFVKKLREEMKFQGLDALISQLKEDRSNAKQILATVSSKY